MKTETSLHIVRVVIGVGLLPFVPEAGVVLLTAKPLIEAFLSAKALLTGDKAKKTASLEARLAKQVETYITSHKTEYPDADQAALLLTQMIEASLPSQTELVGTTLTADGALQAMLAKLPTLPEYQTPAAKSLFDAVVRDVLTEVLNDADFVATLRPEIIRALLDGITTGRDTNRMVKKIYDDREKTENPIRLKLTTAQKLAAQFGADIGDIIDYARLEAFLEVAAGRTEDLTRRLQASSNEDDPVVQRLRKEAAVLIDDGEFDAADAKLAQAEERDTEIEREQLESVNRSKFSRAKSRSERGDLARLRQRYREAADHYAAAASMVPSADTAKRWYYYVCQGAMLFVAGTYIDGKEAMSESIRVYREAALPLAPRDRVPLNWAWTQLRLGNALSSFGRKQNELTLLKEAVAAFRWALKEYTLGREPEKWAETQSTLGSTLVELSEREGGTTRLKEAIVSFREALKVYTRDRKPIQWMNTQFAIARAFLALSTRSSDLKHLRLAHIAFDQALDLVRSVDPAYHSTIVELYRKKFFATPDPTPRPSSSTSSTAANCSIRNRPSSGT